VTESLCRVWWGSPSDATDGLWDLLSPAERERYDRLRRPADRDRSVVGAATLRLAAGAVLGVPPGEVPIDRSCLRCAEQHGKPTLPPETGLHCSVSHSGERIAVALGSGAALGVDVEALDRAGSLEVERLVLTDDERVGWLALPEAERRAALYEYWTRKEAVLKATGDGLNVAMTGLRVSAPDEPPAVLAFDERPSLVGGSYLARLSPGAGYVACLAILDPRPREVVEAPAAEVLASA
jgi:4'-phosphopantetheinyl transferase